MINKSAKKLKTESVASREDGVRCQLAGGTWVLPCASLSTSRLLSLETRTSHCCSDYAVSVNYIAKEFQNKFCRLRKRALYHAASCPLKEKAQFKTCYDKHMLLAIQTTRKNNWERVNKVSFGKQPILAGVWRKVPVVFSSVRPKKNRNCIKVGETRNCALIIILWLKWKHRISHLSSFDRSMLKKGQIISISHHYF